MESEEKWKDYQSVFTAAKAGMEQVDKEKVKKIVYEMSKDSAHFKNEQRKQANVDAKVEKLKQQAAKLTATQLSKHTKLMDAKIAMLEAGRDLSRVWLHVDMDAFYASVEELDNPSLRDVPMAVGGMSMISTANYKARKFGVRSAMPGFIAKKLCPDLVFVPTNFDKYTAVSAQTRAVFRCYDPDFEAGSLDEAYLDVTDHCSKHGVTGAQVAEEIRRRVREEVRVTCSCGVAPNKMLAKVCSDLNKPDGQYVLPSKREAVVAFIRTLSIRKVPCVGKVTEQTLAALGMHTCKDVLDSRGLVAALLTPKSVDFFMRSCLGISATRHPPKLSSDEPWRKGISCERTFRAMSAAPQLEAKLRELVSNLVDHMARESIEGKTLTLKLKATSFHVITRAATLPAFASKSEDMLPPLMALLRAELPIELRLMGVRASNLRKIGAGTVTGSLDQFVTRVSPTKSSGASADGRLYGSMQTCNTSGHADRDGEENPAAHRSSSVTADAWEEWPAADKSPCLAGGERLCGEDSSGWEGSPVRVCSDEADNAVGVALRAYRADSHSEQHKAELGAVKRVTTSGEGEDTAVVFESLMQEENTGVQEQGEESGVTLKALQGSNSSTQVQNSNTYCDGNAREEVHDVAAQHKSSCAVEREVILPGYEEGGSLDPNLTPLELTLNDWQQVCMSSAGQALVPPLSHPHHTLNKSTIRCVHGSQDLGSSHAANVFCFQQLASVQDSVMSCGDVGDQGMPPPAKRVKTSPPGCHKCSNFHPSQLGQCVVQLGPRNHMQQPLDRGQQPGSSVHQHHDRMHETHSADKPCSSTQQPDSSIQQQHDKAHQPHDRVQQPHGRLHLTHDSTPQVHNSLHQPHGDTQQPFNTSQQPHGITQQPHNSLHQPHDNAQQPHKSLHHANPSHHTVATAAADLISCRTNTMIASRSADASGGAHTSHTSRDGVHQTNGGIAPASTQAADTSPCSSGGVHPAMGGITFRSGEAAGGADVPLTSSNGMYECHRPASDTPDTSPSTSSRAFWTCSACTYAGNLPHHLRCEVCETLRAGVLSWEVQHGGDGAGRKLGSGAKGSWKAGSKPGRDGRKTSSAQTAPPSLSGSITKYLAKNC